MSRIHKAIISAGIAGVLLAVAGATRGHVFMPSPPKAIESHPPCLGGLSFAGLYGGEPVYVRGWLVSYISGQNGTTILRVNDARLVVDDGPGAVASRLAEAKCED
jgi:hypothetical protein